MQLPNAIDIYIYIYIYIYAIALLLLLLCQYIRNIRITEHLAEDLPSTATCSPVIYYEQYSQVIAPLVSLPSSSRHHALHHQLSRSSISKPAGVAMQPGG